MPKINVNGVVREMTDEEVRELEALTADIPVQRESELEKRLEKLEGALNLLLGAWTE